jgi:hypothetical protein
VTAATAANAAGLGAHARVFRKPPFLRPTSRRTNTKIQLYIYIYIFAPQGEVGARKGGLQKIENGRGPLLQLLQLLQLV